MKSSLIAILILSFCFVSAQPKRSPDQTERLDAKNGFRKYIFGTALPYFNNKIDKQVADARTDTKLFKFKNEELKIGYLIKAQWIIYEFVSSRFNAVSIKIESGSKELYEFLLREYGEPDIKPVKNGDNKMQFYQWKGKQAYIQIYYTEGKEGATFIVSSSEPKTIDTDVRQGF